jgi:low temperature requirement protein LtrA
MIGFAMIGTYFDPNEQVQILYQMLSYFLAISRLTLAVQYTAVLLQARRYCRGRTSLMLTVIFNVVAAAVYLGISFRFQEGKNSRVFIVWYVGSFLEMTVHLQVARLSKAIHFVGTHLGERFHLLTLIIMGEGAIILAKNVTLVVKDTYLKDPHFGLWSELIRRNEVSGGILTWLT